MVTVTSLLLIYFRNRIPGCLGIVVIVCHESASRDSPLAVTAPIAYPIWFLTPNTRVRPLQRLGPSVIGHWPWARYRMLPYILPKSSSAFSWFNVTEYTFAVLQYPIPTRSEVLAAATLSSGFCSSGLTCVPSDGGR